MSENQKPKKNLLFPSLSGLCVRCAVFGLAIGVAPFFNDYHWTIDLASHFQVQAAFCLVVFLLITLLARKFGSFVIILLILALPLYHLQPLVKSETNITSPSPQSIKVTVLNVLTSNNEKEAVSTFLKTVDSDIVALCETDQLWTEHLTKELKDLYPHHLSDPSGDNFGALILSKFPLTKSGRQHLTEDEKVLLHAAMATPLGPIRIFCAHPTPPVGGELSENRNTYLADLTKLALSSDIPVIVAGDLNATRWSAAYRHLVETADLRDLSDGKGFFPTWNPFNFLLTSLHIDHLLTSKSLAASSYEAGPDIGSDHRAVTATIQRYKP